MSTLTILRIVTEPPAFAATNMAMQTQREELASRATLADEGRPLRVCHLGKFYPPASGGIETHLQTIAQAQARAGLAVQVLCVNHLDRAGRDVTWKRFAATSTRDDRDGAVEVVRIGRRASLARLDFCPSLLGRLRDLARRCDLLHLHVPNPTMLLALCAVRPKTPWVITYHSDVVKQKSLLMLQRPFENWVFQRAAKVLATSPEYPKGSEYLQRFAEKTIVTPFGIDLDEYLEPTPEASRLADNLRQQHGQPLWLAVGRLVYYKGLDIAIRALAEVPGRLMIVGDGPLRGELETLARQTGVADRIVWRGHLSRDELIGAYHAATALWFPSNARSEAFGLVQVEAMASGCPALNCSIAGSGVPWVSRHEETGLTVGVNDWKAFAAAANRLVNEPGLRDRLSIEARTRACREFAADLMAARTLNVYRQALAATNQVPS